MSRSAAEEEQGDGKPSPDGLSGEQSVEESPAWLRAVGWGLLLVVLFFATLALLARLPEL